MFGCFVEALAGLIYIWVILSCVSSSSGVLWCTAVHRCDQSLWVWSAVIITALHSLKSTFVRLVSIENVLLLVEVLTHYMSEFLVIFHGGKIFHSSCNGNLSNEAYFKTTNYFSIVTLFSWQYSPIHLFIFAFIHFCFCCVIVMQTTIENNNINFGGEIYLIMFWIKWKQTLIKMKPKTMNFCIVALFSLSASSQIIFV